jgi:hypothetical protein
MARDSFGFQTERKRDKQGRPLKLISPPPTDEYRDGWERTFGKKPDDKEGVTDV